MYFVSQVLGGDPAACAARQFLLALDACGFNVRLLNRDHTRILQPAMFSPEMQRVYELSTTSVTQSDTLVVHGSVMDLAAITDSDMPPFCVGVLANTPAKVTVWHLEIFRRFGQIWTADEDLINQVALLDPRIDMRHVPLPFRRLAPHGDIPRETMCEGAEAHGFYSFSTAAAEILTWALRSGLQGQLALAPYAGLPIDGTMYFDALKSVPEERARNLELLSGALSSLDHQRANIHYRFDFYLSYEGDHPYFEAEAAAYGNKFSRIEQNTILVNGVTQWAFSTYQQTGAIAQALLEELKSLNSGNARTRSAESDVQLLYVIPHYARGLRWVEACCAALMSQLSAHDHVMIVDLGSSESVRQQLTQWQAQMASHESRVSVHCAAGGWNLSRARNIGVWAYIDECRAANRSMNATHVVFLDVDVLVPATFGADVRRALRDSATSSCLVVRVGNHTEWLDASQLPCEQWPTAPEYVRPGTGNAIIPLEAFFQARGYDESYQGWGSEDVELLARLRHMGLTVRECFEAPPAYHQPHPRAPQADAEMERNIYKLLADCRDLARTVNAEGWGYSSDAQEASINPDNTTESTTL